MTRLPDRARSRAVLIGCSQYEFLDNLPAVTNNLHGLREVLTDPAVGGFDRANCTVLDNPKDGESLVDALVDLARESEDTLLVYFTGHGLLGSRNELFLTLPRTRRQRLGVTALAYDLVRETLRESPAINRVVILDCCFAGSAIRDMAAGDDGIGGQVQIEGTYILTAVAANKPALAPQGAHYSTFTGVLLEQLRAGIPDGPNLYTLAALFPRLKSTLSRRQLPEPRQFGTDTIAGLALTRNPVARQSVIGSEFAGLGSAEVAAHGDISSDAPARRRPSSTSLPGMTDATFFVSYSREDAAYAARLVGHLRRHELPAWFDEHLTWGTRYAAEIRDRIAASLAVLVIMSPAAEKSHWVENEILEGQRRDRFFLPILLHGDPLFLLASSHCFDARDGALPGAAELKVLHQLRSPGAPDSTSVPVWAPPPLVAPVRSSVQGRLTPRPPSTPTQQLGCTTALRRLDRLLSAGELEHGDILTTAVLLETAGRAGNGWLRRMDGEAIGFDVLTAVDEVWSGISNGQQGFRRQLLLHGRAPVRTPAGGYGDFQALAAALGWKRGRDPIPRYGEFVARSRHDAGFFPTLRNPQLESQQTWHDRWLETVMAVHVHLRTWGGQG